MEHPEIEYLTNRLITLRWEIACGSGDVQQLQNEHNAYVDRLNALKNSKIFKEFSKSKEGVSS